LSKNQTVEAPLKSLSNNEIGCGHPSLNQGVGGSNPLFPTNLFNNLQSISGLPPLAVLAILELREPQKINKRIFCYRFFHLAQTNSRWAVRY
jgi:hypothetical protein